MLRYKQEKNDLQWSGRRWLAAAARAASGAPAGAHGGRPQGWRQWGRGGGACGGPAQVRRGRLVQRAEEMWFQETFFRFCKFIVIIDVVWLMLPT